MNMKTLRKILAAICATALIVCISVGATIAYLTSNDQVVNTFTVGKVEITMDEENTDTLGVPTAEEDARVDTNEYHLLPGHTYTKDPTVHVDADSESCWLFVKVENGIADIEAATETTEGGYKKIADQILANGWKLLEEGGNVYYHKYENVEGAELDFKVFDNFKIDSEKSGDEIKNFATLKDANDKPVQGAVTVSVTAYAIQVDGIDTAAEAWELGNWN